MSFNEWKYYNHAIIQNVPSAKVNEEDVFNKGLWKIEKEYAFLIRWTSNFDCKSNTQWWYVIKDSPFCIDEIKSKYRYVIKRGIKFFYVKKIDPLKFEDRIYFIYCEAYKTYPKKYRPFFSKEEAHKLCKSLHDNKTDVLGGFLREDDSLCGVIVTPIIGNYINFFTLHVIPNYEKYEINAAMVYGMLNTYEHELGNGYYICDGSRSVSHETKFQDYLEKYFSFRKAYCDLHIKYRWWVKIIVNLFYPFRNIINHKTNNKMVYSIYSVLKMEEYHRTFGYRN